MDIKLEQPEWYKGKILSESSNATGWIKKMKAGHLCMYIAFLLPIDSPIPTIEELQNCTSGHWGITFEKFRTEVYLGHRTVDVDSIKENFVRDMATPTRQIEIGWDYNHIDDEYKGWDFEAVKLELERVAQELVEAGYIFDWNGSGKHHFKRVPLPEPLAITNDRANQPQSETALLRN